MQQRCATSCNDVPHHSPEDSITVCCAGKTIHWTENKQHSGNSKSIILAPLAQVSDMNDSSSLNYNKFAALMNPVSNEQRKWVVPPKTKKEIEDERRDQEERLKVGQQMKRDRLAKTMLLHKLTQELMQELPQEMP